MNELLHRSSRSVELLRWRILGSEIGSRHWRRRLNPIHTARAAVRCSALFRLSRVQICRLLLLLLLGEHQIVTLRLVERQALWLMIAGRHDELRVRQVAICKLRHSTHAIRSGRLRSRQQPLASQVS